MRDLNYGVKLIERHEWGARAPTSITPLNPTYGATRHWGGPGFGGLFPHESCAPKVRAWQNFHMGPARGWSDIAYTGVVCPHDFVFEGRGLWRRTAANGTNTGNNTAYAFCYLGGEGDPFTEGGKRGMRAAMDWTRDHGGAGPHRNDHNDWKLTACPGPEIEAWGDSGEPIQLPQPTPKGTISDMQTLVVHPEDPNRVDVALIGQNKHVFHGVARSPEELLTVPFEDLGGAAKSIASAWVSGQYVITVQGSGGDGDNALYVNRYVSDEEGWTGWLKHPTALLLDPEANV